VDLKEYGLETEPTVQESITTGAEAACFSGDKLIGGPQAGIIVGKARTIEKIRKNPLARAFRIGKITIAAMEATLRLFLTPEKLNEGNPTHRMLSLNIKKLEKRAQKIKKNLTGLAAQIEVIDGVSQVGSGSVPTETVPTKLLSVTPAALSVSRLARELRYGNPAIFARVRKEAVLFDLRTIQPDEDAVVRDALTGMLKPKE
jgi:L-seryl-tRNA(Ser) seleniumtransferase